MPFSEKSFKAQVCMPMHQDVEQLLWWPLGFVCRLHCGTLQQKRFWLLLQAASEKHTLCMQVQKKVERLVAIWDERKVFGESGTKPFKELVAATESPGKASGTPSFSLHYPPHNPQITMQ